MHKNKLKLYYFIDDFDPNHLLKLDKNISFIYRNYSKKKYLRKILELRNFCLKNKRKLYISNNFKLAINLRLNGVYIPSFNKNLNILTFKDRKNFKIIGSAHNIKEIRIKEKQKVQELFISPIFKTYKDKFLEIYKFNNLMSLTKINKIALGGISNKNIKRLNLIKISGIAGIKLFKKKGPHE